MTYRVLCDENVDPQTVQYLERDGHDDTRPHRTTRERRRHNLAEYAKENTRLVLTNHDDFLSADAFPDVTVLYVPDDTLPAHDLASMVAVIASYCPEQDDLPRESFLTEALL